MGRSDIKIVSQTYFVSKFCYKVSIYNIILVPCYIKQISLQFDNSVLKWQVSSLTTILMHPKLLNVFHFLFNGLLFLATPRGMWDLSSLSRV